MECRELSVAEAIACGLPAREPIPPYERLVWFSCEAYEASEFSGYESAARHEAI